MAKVEPSKAGMALTDVILDLFRVNSLLLMQGDRLVSDLGLTSARWQVLGAIVYAPRPEPVAPERSASLRDSLGEAERAEEAARQERESAAMRQPVGLD